MKRARQRCLRFLLCLVLLAAFPFLFLPFPSEPSDPDPIDTLAPVEIVAEGFDEPAGVLIDRSGALLISDRKAGQVLKITGNKVEPLIDYLKGPVGLASDVEGRLLIVEEGSGQLLRLGDDGSLTVVAKGMKEPRWATVAEDGTLYISAKGLRSTQDRKEEDEDEDNGEQQVILRLTPRGEVQIFVAGFGQVEGLVVHEGKLFAAARGSKGEDENGGVFEIPIQSDGTAGTISRLTRQQIKNPVGLARDRLGGLYIGGEELELTKKATNVIGKLTSDGTLSCFASKLEKPNGLAFDSSGNLYVADHGGDKKGRVLRFRAPPPPTLTFPYFTNQSPLTIHGKTEPDSGIDAFLNDSATSLTGLTDDGAFALTLNLNSNAENSLDVFTTGHDGMGLTSAAAEITIIHDKIPPLISNIQPLNGSFLNTPIPVIRADFSDNLSAVDTARVVIELDGSNVSSQARVTPSGFTLNPVTPLPEGVHTGAVTLFDRAGNSVFVSTSFTIDLTLPLITNLTPSDGSVVTTDHPVISAQFGDNFGINPASVKIFLDGTEATSLASIGPFGFTLDSYNPSSLTLFPLSQGHHTFSVTVSDLADNPASATATFTVTTRPEITAFSPGSGTLGTEVTIHGTSFDPTPGRSVVRFNGVRAVSTSITQTTIKTFVPLGATTGRITVETPQGIGTSSDDFIAQLRQDFAPSVSPAVGIAVQGTSTSYSVLALSTGIEPFTGLVGLTVAGLPPAVTAAFMPATLGSSTSGILTLTTTSSTPVGSKVVEVHATAQIEGHTVTRTATITLGVQAPGQTVLVGEVRDQNDRPLTGVSIKQGGSTITNLGVTDAGGNFFIPLSVIGQQIFLIDGSTANTAATTYSTIPVTLDIQSGVVNTLGFTPRLHGQAVVNLTPITPGQAVVLTDPEIPGFKMTIPIGVQIIGWDGKPNTQFSVTPVPIDRSPLPPFPAGQSSRQIYLFNFGKMGGGIPTGNISIDTPNDVDGLPGEKVDLYYFNEAPDGTAPNQWEKYGTGTVSSDGTRIITDTNPATGLPYGIPRFCCGARRNVPPPPPPRPGGGPSGGASDSGQKAGEPVDTATGFFYLDKTDLVLPGILPVAITRTYRTQLTNAGPFGLGTSWPYDIFLQPPPNGSPDTLILFTPGNRQDLFARQSDGSFLNSTSPALRGAAVTVTGGVRSLRFKDGSLWRFDTTGRLISQGDRNGNVLTLIRDGQGRVTGITEPLGRQLTIFYTGANLQIDRIQDPMGREVRYGYDASGRLINVTDAAGAITRYTYDNANRMASIIDPRGITFLTNVYDSTGRVIRQTQADGGVWTLAYTTTGAFISHTTVTDPRANSTTYRFNAAGYLISQTDALGQTTISERQSGPNLLLATIDPLGRKTGFSYDPNGNVTSITDPAGNVRRFEYELTFNKLIKIADPLGQITRFEYDAKGNLTATVDPTGARTTVAYNEFGQPVSTTDPLGNTTRFTYDSNGNLATIADPLGNKTQRAYDLVSRLIEQIDPRGRSTRFAYDGLNRVTQIIDALNGVTSFGYDGNGNLLTVTDAKAQTTAYTYDVMDRVSTRTDPLGWQEKYQYDAAGNLVQATDRTNQVSTYTYDVLNRRVKSNFADGTFTEFTYDAAGRLSQTTDSQGGIILEEYDLLDHLNREITPQGLVAYTYDALGRRTRMDVTGQAPVTYSYDAASRLTQVMRGAQVVNLDYDNLGRRTRLTLPNGVSTEYIYDAASRLTELIYRNVIGILGNLTYQYDAASNRIAVDGTFARTLLPDPVSSAIYDIANRQLQFDDKTMTFDANGNLTAISDTSGTSIFTWDARNRLLRLTGPSTTALFTYDALGRRLTKTIQGLTTSYQYDGINPIQEISEGNTVTSLLTGLGVDEFLTRNNSAGTQSLVPQALGSILALTDSAGTIQTEYAYEPFGKVATAGLSSSNPFQYTGRENDASGLYYYRARYYHPSLQRFISEDPLEFAGGHINLYNYVQNNPIKYTDPTGLVCGSGWNDPFVPDSWYGQYDFTNACRQHDDCYGQCGKSKTACDNEFYKSMLNECNKRTGYWYNDCMSTAQIYFYAVKRFGGGAYKAAQALGGNLRR